MFPQIIQTRSGQEGNFQVKYKDPAPKLPDGTTYDRVDIDKSLAENTIIGNEAKFTQNFNDRVKNYSTRSKVGGKHAAAIEAVKDFRDSPMLGGTAPACPKP